MGFAYSIKLGNLRINFQKGKNNNIDGILLQTRINGQPLTPNQENIKNWFSEAHTLSSNLFKQLTEGELYESFN